MASLNDLQYAFYGGTPSLSDAMYAFFKQAFDDGLTAADIVAAAVGGDFFGSYADSGSPEGEITAPVGSIYADVDTDQLYVKHTGGGNTGWDGAIAFGLDGDDVDITAAGDLTIDAVTISLFGAVGSGQGVAITDPSGGATVDAAARTAIIAILDLLRARGDIAT